MNPNTKVSSTVKPVHFTQKRKANGTFAASVKAKIKHAVRKTVQAAGVTAILALALAFGGAFYSTQTITDFSFGMLSLLVSTIFQSAPSRIPMKSPVVRA